MSNKIMALFTHMDSIFITAAYIGSAKITKLKFHHICDIKF